MHTVTLLSNKQPTNSSPSNQTGFSFSFWAILLYPTVTTGATIHCDQEHMKITRSCKGYQKNGRNITRWKGRRGEGGSVSAPQRWLLTCMTAGSDTGWKEPEWSCDPWMMAFGLNWVCSSLSVCHALAAEADRSFSVASFQTTVTRHQAVSTATAVRTKESGVFSCWCVSRFVTM